MKFQNILCPTDFSESAAKALTLADEMAAQFDGKLNLLHVVYDLNIYSGAASTMAWYPTMYVDLEKIAHEEMQKTLKSVKRAKRVSSKIERGTGSDLILNYARANGCDLIVMGTHGRSGIERLVMGSTTELVIRHAECPVLTVRL
ncbi:MAG: universal stress protein [Spirochaetia bacterium]|nr:universal stress protein [Spirochaetia bacterium]